MVAKMAAAVVPTEAEKPKLTYSKVSLSLENCILPQDKFSTTPSEADGLDREVEIELRVLGCELIQTSGVLLRLPQVAMATGQVLFQRFFYSKSFVRHPMEIVAMACVTLASKIEEAPRRIRDVVSVFHHIKQVRAGKTIQPFILDQNYINQKNQVIKAERRVLKELGFCVHVKHPHKIIVTLLEVLKVKNQRLMQTAWNYMNDSLRSEVFVRYPPETIACACICLSARVLQIPLPNKPAWYLIFDASDEDIYNICQIILSLYSLRKPDPDKLDKVVEEVKKVHLEKKLKAKGVATATAVLGNHVSFSPSSNPSSPKNDKASPIVPAVINIKKEKEEVKHSNGISPIDLKEINHRKRKSPTPVEDGYGSPHRKKKTRSSSSESASTLSPSPKRGKHKKTPPRSFKDSRHSQSPSSAPKAKKSKHRSSHKSKKSHSFSPPPSPHKHSTSTSSASKKAYKSKSKSHRNKSPSSHNYEHNHHSNYHEKSHKSRKEKSNHHSREKSHR